MTRRRLINTSVAAACASVLAQGLAGCAAAPSSPTPRGGAAAVVLEVVAAPKPGAKANRFTRVPVYDAAPRPAAPPAGQYELVNYSALDDVIVWLEPAGAADASMARDGASDRADDAATDATRPAVPPPSPLALDVSADVHPDDVHAVALGQELVFRNRGAEPVALYSVSDDNDFELPEIPPGGEAHYTVRSTGLIEVLAGSADPPVATVYAAPTPWVARTRAGGWVVFDDVTPGPYEAMSWHPRLPGSTAAVNLTPGSVARTALKVGVNVLGEQQP
jgi:hypothetical protein